MSQYLIHYGMPKRSGRYPYGSGDRPYQRENKQYEKKKKALSKITDKKFSKKELISRNDIDRDKGLYLKKGEKVQHISGVDMDKINPGQLYVTANEYDNKLYETFLSGMLRSKGFGSKKITLVLKEDLKSPSEKEQYSLFKKMNKEQVLQDVSKWLVEKGKFKNQKTASEYLYGKSDRELYSDFINSCEKKSDSRTIFYNFLKKEGYNAVLDIHDRESWISAKQPIILMEVLDVVGDMKMSEISVEDINRSLNEWIKMNSR